MKILAASREVPSQGRVVHRMDGVVWLAEGEKRFQGGNVVKSDESTPISKDLYASTATRILLLPSALGLHLRLVTVLSRTSSNRATYFPVFSGRYSRGRCRASLCRFCSPWPGTRHLGHSAGTARRCSIAFPGIGAGSGRGYRWFCVR